MPRVAKKLTVRTLQTLHAQLNELAIASPAAVAAFAVLVAEAHRVLARGQGGVGRVLRPTPTLRGRREVPQYLARLPKVVPPESVLVHNHVQPTRRLGSRGFRAWLAPPDPAQLEPCDCGWAPELGPHYRTRKNPWRE